MQNVEFQQRLKALLSDHQLLLNRKNVRVETGNGIFDRYKYPVVTAAHTPIFWRYDVNPDTNPLLLERIGINAAFNAGAIEFDNKICLAVRVESADRKSFFAIAESPNGIDNFRFWDYPVSMPETDNPDTNVYDLRFTKHEDGWIYGVFCTERKDPDAAPGNLSAAVAQAGIARTKDLKDWERLPDLKTGSKQQRNAVLHPEFVDGKYAFYTRPQDSFIETGNGGGIGWGLCDDITNPEVKSEKVIEERIYHSIKELKNGQGPAPLRTEIGWIHLAHGVRNCAAGLRYVLYLFVTSLQDPSRVTHQPGGYLIAPEDEERIGDVSNVVFSNGWVARETGDVFIYYASSDTRLHVATTSLEKLIDYAQNTPPDPLRSASCVQQRNELIANNLKYLETHFKSNEFR